MFVIKLSSIKTFMNFYLKKPYIFVQNNLLEFEYECCEFVRLFCSQKLVLNVCIKAFWYKNISCMFFKVKFFFLFLTFNVIIK